MPRFYRLVKAHYVATAFDGAGAKTYGGRWNSKGQPCVYLASSIALCLLETLVHLADSDILPSFTLLAIEIPEQHIMRLDSALLPTDWQQDPAPESTKLIGDEWLSNQSSLLLEVPSTITGEFNALFNPSHPAAIQALSSITPQQFTIDARLI